MKKLITIALLASVVFAADFSTIDKNSDGMLNKEEFRLYQSEQIKMKNKCDCPDRCNTNDKRSQNKVVYDLSTGEGKKISNLLGSI